MTFRRGLTGPAAVSMLTANDGKLLIQLPVGVGKSRWLIDIAGHALQSFGAETLVIILAPRWDILNEIHKRLPRHVKPILLHPRPSKRCGALDEQWHELETRGCGLLGRQILCRPCPGRHACEWPDRQADALAGSRLVLATQQNLSSNPRFISQLKVKSGATSTLLLLDESDLLLKPFRCEITADQLTRFLDVVAVVAGTHPHLATIAAKWVTYLGLLQTAPDLDLQSGNWKPPPMPNNVALTIQEIGRRMFGNSYYYLAYKAEGFAQSDKASRERTEQGGLRFAVIPGLGERWIVFSGSIAPSMLHHRIDPNRITQPPYSPFTGLRFSHPDTRWHNLAMAAGAARYFPKNRGLIFDFFARLISRNIASRKRTLLVGRKRFLPMICKELPQYLADLGAGKVRIVIGNWDRHRLADPQTLPLISYGLSGVNRFEDYDAAYCITGYYIPHTVVETMVNDLEATAQHMTVRINCRRTPPRRQAVVVEPSAAMTVAPMLAQNALVQKEADVVVQAVGRVRPFTKPREIITMHLGDLPGIDNVTQFPNLAVAREHFQLPTPSVAARVKKIAEVARLTASGMSQAEIANLINVSISTVKRYIAAHRDQNAS